MKYYEFYCYECGRKTRAPDAPAHLCWRCRQKEARADGAEINRAWGVGLSTGKIGAVGELLASADLIMRGYDVYRAVSPSAPYDLVATKGPRILRIEVRCGRKNKDGSLCYPKPQVECETTAIIIGTEVVYEPALPSAL